MRAENFPFFRIFAFAYGRQSKGNSSFNKNLIKRMLLLHKSKEFLYIILIFT